MEIPVLNNSNTKFNFGDDETGLDNVWVTAVSLMPNIVALAPSGRAVYPTAEAMKGYLTLCDKNKVELNKQLPLETFLRSDSIIHIRPKLISLRNSYVDLPLVNAIVIPAGPPAGLSLLFTFFYLDTKPDRNYINGGWD